MKPIHIALDLDGTLAEYHGDISIVGKPIPLMLHKLRIWLSKGYKVTIFTARVSSGDIHHTPEHIQAQREMISQWLVDNGLPALDITSDKLPTFSHIVDDRAYHAIKNNGIIYDFPRELM